jgi:hypothetical protein
MATDAQGRTLSDDGHYYWDGSAWQPVQAGDAAQGGDASSSQNPSLENYSGDGSDLTGDQKQYLSQYLVRTPTVGPDSVDNVGAGQLSDQSTEQEWA